MRMLTNEIFVLRPKYTVHTPNHNHRLRRLDVIPAGGDNNNIRIRNKNAQSNASSTNTNVQFEAKKACDTLFIRT